MDNSKSTIVIVGAGPVGLWTAIQLKKRNAACDVIVHERHQTYQRSHVLNLKQLSMLMYNTHSRIRKEIFGDRFWIDTKLQYVAELKYEIEGAAKPLAFLKEHCRTMKILPYLAFEYAGREKNGVTPVTIRFFIPSSVYKTIGEASFKAPILVNGAGHNLPKPLFDVINLYLTIRKTSFNETLVPESLKLTKLHLSAYVAQQAACEWEGCYWFLAGDAASGVPYFRSLNTGMICASRLAQLLTRHDPAFAMAKYIRYV